MTHCEGLDPWGKGPKVIIRGHCTKQRRSQSLPWICPLNLSSQELPGSGSCVFELCHLWIYINLTFYAIKEGTKLLLKLVRRTIETWREECSYETCTEQSSTQRESCWADQQEFQPKPATSMHWLSCHACCQSKLKGSCYAAFFPQICRLI